jgi:adenine phosphoribosyltransferase
MSSEDTKVTQQAVAEPADLKLIKSLITAHVDFPLPGIVFRDIFPVLRNPVAFEMLLNRMQHHVQATYGAVDVIVGLDSRGFLFAPTLAMRLGAAFVPIRKHGKLPGKVITEAYVKEYGTDKFDIQADAITPGQTVIIVDDLLATGGTLHAAVNLINKVQGKVKECLVVIELDGLNGKAKVDSPVHSLVHY